MVDCSEFLDDYSDFRDGALAPERTERFTRHLATCASCARYDRVLRRGVETLHRLPPIEASYDFGDRLRHRLYHLDDEGALQGRAASGASTGITLALAVAIGAAAWAPAVRPRAPLVELAPVAARAPVTDAADALPELFRIGPLLHSDRGLSLATEQRRLLFDFGTLAQSAPPARPAALRSP